MRYFLPAKSTLIVRGHACVVVTRGELNVFGATLGVGSKFRVNPGKQMPLEAEGSDTELQIALSPSGEIEEVTGSTIPRSWKLACGGIIKEERSRVLVLGATDVGKNALSTMLINESLKRRVPVSIIDADIGQAEIGPPTSMAIGIPRRQVLTLTDIQPRRAIFVGDTSPARVKARILEGIKRFAALIGDKLTIVNTDGWVTGQEAGLFKRRLIQAFRPDLTLLMGSSRTLQNIICKSKVRFLKLESASSIATRSRTQRKELRNSGYGRFLHGAEVRTFPARSLNFKPSNRSIQELNTEMANLIVGLLNSSGYLMQIGVILNLDSSSVEVYTSYRGMPYRIEIGNIRVTTDGTELGPATH